MRDELLANTEFYSLIEAQVLIEDRRIGYNTERPDSSLGYLIPMSSSRRGPRSINQTPHAHG